MDFTNFPPLPEGVECLSLDGPEKGEYEDGGLTFPILRARYRVRGLTVEIGWVIGHEMGSFREPNQLRIDFDSYSYAESFDVTGEDERSEPFKGITTAMLRSIPMAHARALMRDQYEHLAVADVRSEVTPLPSRVETDEDYIHVAQAYVSLVQVSAEPIKRLAEWTGESPDTWSARLRRARTRQVLEGKGLDARISAKHKKTAEELVARLRAKAKVATGGD